MNIQIWIFGPEFGCLNRQIPIIQRLLKRKKNINLQFIIVPKHKPFLHYYFRNEIKRGRCEIITNEKVIYSLKYKPSMDLNIKATTHSIIKNMIKNSPGIISLFRSLKKRYNPDIIVSDFLPEISFLSKINSTKSLGVYNYLTTHTEMMHFDSLVPVVNKAFRFFYRNFDRVLITSVFPENGYEIEKIKDIRIIPPIVRESTKSKNRIRKDLGIKKMDKLVFLSLGGSKFFDEIVSVSQKISKDYDDIKFLLLPRDFKEAKKFKYFENFIVPKKMVFDTQNFVAASDIVITKCGFTTISEAIKFNTNIISVSLPHHPEILETEIILKKTGIIKNSIVTKDDEKTIYEKIIDETNRDFKANVKTNGAEIASKIYLEELK